MKDIKSLDIVFENCECISIETKYLYGFSLSGIDVSISRIALNCIHKMNSVKHTEIVICRDADKEYKPFGVDEYKTTVFDRISTDKDITSLYLRYQDGTEECYYPKWGGDSDYINTYQHSCITPKGNLVLVIDEEYDSIDTYFNKTETNFNDLDKSISFYKYMELDDDTYLTESGK